MNPLRNDQVASIGRDPDLLEAFYREHLGTVKTFLTRRVDDPHEVADLLADTFMAAIDASERYRPVLGSPAAWLLGIARNVHADSRRKAARRRRAERRIEGRRLLDDDSTASIEERIEAERLTRALYASLAQLPARDRALLERVAVDGMTVADAASELGIKPGTARVRLHRSRGRILQYLEAHAPQPGAELALPALFAQEAIR